MINKKEEIVSEVNINRKEAIKKIKSYSKYFALTALATYIILQPQKAQAGSVPSDPGAGF